MSRGGDRRPQRHCRRHRARVAGIQRRLDRPDPLAARAAGRRRAPALMVLLVAVGFVLLIACANVANLMLVRAAAGSGRCASGSRSARARSALIEQMLVESLVLAGVRRRGRPGVAWIGAARAARPAAPAHPAGACPGAALDWRVVAFTVVVSAVTGLTFGIVPAVQASRTNLAEGLRDGARGTLGQPARAPHPQRPGRHGGRAGHGAAGRLRAAASDLRPAARRRRRLPRRTAC